MNKKFIKSLAGVAMLATSMAYADDASVQNSINQFSGQSIDSTLINNVTSLATSNSAGTFTAQTQQAFANLLMQLISEHAASVTQLQTLLQFLSSSPLLSKADQKAITPVIASLTAVGSTPSAPVAAAATQAATQAAASATQAVAESAATGTSAAAAVAATTAAAAATQAAVTAAATGTPAATQAAAVATQAAATATQAAAVAASTGTPDATAAAQAAAEKAAQAADKAAQAAAQATQAAAQILAEKTAAEKVAADKIVAALSALANPAPGSSPAQLALNALQAFQGMPSLDSSIQTALSQAITALQGRIAVSPVTPTGTPVPPVVVSVDPVPPVVVAGPAPVANPAVTRTLSDIAALSVLVNAGVTGAPMTSAVQTVNNDLTDPVVANDPSVVAALTPAIRAALVVPQGVTQVSGTSAASAQQITQALTDIATLASLVVNISDWNNVKNMVAVVPAVQAVNAALAVPEVSSDSSVQAALNQNPTIQAARNTVALMPQLIVKTLTDIAVVAKMMPNAANTSLDEQVAVVTVVQEDLQNLKNIKSQNNPLVQAALQPIQYYMDQVKNLQAMAAQGGQGGKYNKYNKYQGKKEYKGKKGKK
ncbi:hypothetical protein IPF37_01945 [bacterium]|nr:MAG: hypothetical protein IPF37_01945 [bacterium]